MKKFCFLLLTVVSISCENYKQDELEDLSNYVLTKADTLATGQRREVYFFKKNKTFSYEKVFWPNGKLMTENFMKNNFLNGLCLIYTPTGKLGVKAYYKNGFKNGRLTGYDDNGKVRICEIYKNGKLISQDCK